MLMYSLSELKRLVEDALPHIVPEHWVVETHLARAMEYSLHAGGKRLRPMLVLAATAAVGGDVARALPAACAIECVHTYSLIHDDLPAMDDDDLRRGVLTNHKVFGEAMAILAGDALLTHAFYVLATMPDVPDGVIVQLVRLLSTYGGASGMVGGQALDVGGCAPTIDALDAMHQRKTGDLIVCALLMGGCIGGASDAQRDALERCGRAMGLAFQIQDDILDVIGDTATLGKRVHSDIANGKRTYATIAGIEQAQETVRTLTDGIAALINKEAFAHPDVLLQIAHVLLHRTH
ncbi:MAG: polyprenyl synthetase family protein [Paenibacillaceae bacterium]|nr:polyprenyl synthetase family protein [Paenibacillaceae bacterium]